jgi:hypothetical protein
VAALASGQLEEAVTGIARSLEHHELMYLDPSPSCSPVLEPLLGLKSYRDLLAKHGIGRCERTEKTVLSVLSVLSYIRSTTIR